MTTQEPIAKQIAQLKPATCRWCKHLRWQRTTPELPREQWEQTDGRCPGGTGPANLDEGHLCRWFSDVRKDKR